MAKLKITKPQILMLQNLSSNAKRLKITESQYKKLFTEKKLSSNDKPTNKLKFAQEIIVLIKDAIKDTKNFKISSYWKDLGISKKKLLYLLRKEGILSLNMSNDGDYKYASKKQGFRKGVNNIYNESIIRNSLTESDGLLPTGSEFDPNAPWNQENNSDDDFKESIKVERKKLTPLLFSDKSDGIAIFKNKGRFYAFDGSLIDEYEYAPYMDSPNVIDDETVYNYVNDKLNKKELRISNNGFDGFTKGEVTSITPQFKETLFKYYGDDIKLVDALNQLPESTTSASSGQYVGNGTSNLAFNSELSPEEAMDELINDGKIIDNLEDNEIDETTSTVSGGVGAFSDTTQTVGNLEVPLGRDLSKDRNGVKQSSTSIIRRPIGRITNEGIFGKSYKVDQIYMNGGGRAKITKINKDGTLLVRRWGDIPAKDMRATKKELSGWKLIENTLNKTLKITEAQLKKIIENNGGKVNNEKNTKNVKRTKANNNIGKINEYGKIDEDKRYIAEIDFYLWGKNDKLANLKLKEILSYINSEYVNSWAKPLKLYSQPFGTLGSTPVKIEENKTLKESLLLKFNKENNILVVASNNSDPKKASSETFSSKNILKKNGFKWNGTNWTISSEKLDVAKKTLTEVNKIEYFVDKLEDLDEILSSATGSKNLVTSKLDQYILDLANATDEASASAEIRRFLTFFSKFRQYSFYNSILIYIQNPKAKRVAGFKKWKEVNRGVKRGYRPITILAPIFGKKEENDTEKEPINGIKVDKRSPVGFRAVRVIDVEDTYAIDKNGELPEEPKWWGENDTNETANILVKNLEVVIGELGIELTTSDKSNRGEKGYSKGDHINLLSDSSGGGKAATLVHELAHEMMHWKNKSMYYIGDEAKRDRALLELQAESVSYVVLKHYGIPVKHHATYLALWKANKDKILKYMKLIADVSDFIIREVDKVAKYNTNKVTTSESINEILKEIGFQ